jgi:hypothetical protein
MNRGTVGTPKKRSAFIDALRQCGNVQEACESSGVPRRTAYNWRDADADFAAAWEGAVEEAADRMEREAFRRAVEGTNKPVYQQGRQVGEIREYSDTLLIFLLKGAKPEKYRERQELTGAGGAPLIPAITEVVIERTVDPE